MIWKLLIIFQLKHLFSDYFLQTEYMLQKSSVKRWFFPLATHCTVHAAMTLSICALIRPDLMWLGAVDFAIHFGTDRLKVLATRHMSPANSTYWYALGVDQTVHHLTHYFVIFCIVSIPQGWSVL
jgi:hypothetical protein